MAVFLIDSYEVTAAALRQVGNAVEVPHTLLLKGTPEGNTSVNTAVIMFTAQRHPNYPGTVNQNSIIAFLTDNVFASWYDILRSENPVKLRFTPDGGPNLNLIQIFTGPEPAGEGPADG